MNVNTPSGETSITIRPQVIELKTPWGPGSSMVTEPSAWKVKRVGPEMLYVIDVPVLRFVNRATTLPVWSSTTSPLGSGGNVFAMDWFTGNSRSTAKLQNSPAGNSVVSKGTGDRVGLP